MLRNLKIHESTSATRTLEDSQSSDLQHKSRARSGIRTCQFSGKSYVSWYVFARPRQGAGVRGSEPARHGWCRASQRPRVPPPTSASHQHHTPRVNTTPSARHPFSRCRANMAHVRQPRLDPGLAFQVTALRIFQPLQYDETGSEFPRGLVRIHQPWSANDQIHRLRATFARQQKVVDRFQTACVGRC